MYPKYQRWKSWLWAWWIDSWVHVLSETGIFFLSLRLTKKPKSVIDENPLKGSQ